MSFHPSLSATFTIGAMVLTNFIQNMARNMLHQKKSGKTENFKSKAPCKVEEEEKKAKTFGPDSQSHPTSPNAARDHRRIWYDDYMWMWGG